MTQDDEHPPSRRRSAQRGSSRGRDPQERDRQDQGPQSRDPRPRYRPRLGGGAWLRDLPRPSVSALVGIAVLVLVAAGAIHLSTQGSALAPVATQSQTSAAASSEPVTEGGERSGTGSADAGATSPGPAVSGPSAAGSTAPAELIVHVTGAVQSPGVVTVPAGARVNDAVSAAGGARPEADLSAVNLARPAVDGEQIHVPVPGEQPPPSAGGDAVDATGTETASSSPGTSAGSTSGGLVNINTASAEELDALPGVGPAIAARIVQHRQQNGPFASVEDLEQVSGIGPSTIAKMRDRATV